jgi:hypothetical protein
MKLMFALSKEGKIYSFLRHNVPLNEAASITQSSKIK